MSLLTKFNLALIAVFTLALVPAGWLSHDLLQKSARTQVIENARIMMETALAVRTYTIKQIKPLLAPQLRDDVPPAVGPRLLGDGDLQRPPGDEPRVRLQGSDAQPDEPAQPDGRLGGRRRQGVPERRREARRSSASARRRRGGRSSSAARSGSRTRGCLACHTTPGRARPRRRSEGYGPSNGFGWKLNEIIGAQIVSVPMSLPVKMADQAFRTLLGDARRRLRLSRSSSSTSS